LVKTWPKVPRIALVIFIAIKSPDTADNDERTNPVVPKITEEMETKVGPAGGAFESDVVEDDKLRHRGVVDSMRGTGFARAGVVAQRAHFPFRVDDTAILWRQLGLGY